MSHDSFHYYLLNKSVQTYEIYKMTDQDLFHYILLNKWSAKYKKAIRIHI